MRHKVRSPACRALRGGSWFDDARRARAASRFAFDPSYRTGDLGLRLMRRCP